MPPVKKDNRQWAVKHLFLNDSCPFLYFPANYYGCKLLDGMRDNECTLENCFRRVEAIKIENEPLFPDEVKCQCS